ncbi:MAG: NINE protein [Gordonia sp. (in: high G+C Gram-positive bacteria)]|uniref:NINE protein n=1 Tax=Gordonia sp. (in: high G+C Gram-positive bacteria) TaxID=84139 RepID=UPI0039E678BF
MSYPQQPQHGGAPGPQNPVPYQDPNIPQAYPQAQQPYPVNPYAHPQQPYGQPQPVYSQPQQPYPGQYPGQPLAPGYPVAYGATPLAAAGYSDKDKTTAGLLQLLLGGFGVGRFYLGYSGIGAAQLCLTLLGWLTSWIFGIGLILVVGVGIWALVDAIMMFTGKVPDAQGRPLR